MKRFSRIFTCLGLVALLAGCHPNQKKEVALYRNVLDAQVPRVGEYVDGEPLSLQRSLALPVSRGALVQDARRTPP